VPTLILIAGPNGAGKTTFASEYLSAEDRSFEFVNADEIARGLAGASARAPSDVLAARMMPAFAKGWAPAATAFQKTPFGDGLEKAFPTSKRSTSRSWTNGMFGRVERARSLASRGSEGIMTKGLDIAKVEAALKPVAHKALHGTREERSGRFLLKERKQGTRGTHREAPRDTNQGKRKG
jgi:hypothetical protein